MMLLGWGILAVPTGIVSAEFTAQRFRREEEAMRRCEHTRGCKGHEAAARFCREGGGAGLSVSVLGQLGQLGHGARLQRAALARCAGRVR